RQRDLGRHGRDRVVDRVQDDLAGQLVLEEEALVVGQADELHRLDDVPLLEREEEAVEDREDREDQEEDEVRSEEEQDPGPLGPAETAPAGPGGGRGHCRHGYFLAVDSQRFSSAWTSLTTSSGFFLPSSIATRPSSTAF